LFYFERLMARVQSSVWYWYLCAFAIWMGSGIWMESSAQEGYKTHYGMWRSYQTFRRAKRVVSRPVRQIYFLTDAGVGYADGYRNYREWTRVEGLADAIPTALGYDPKRDIVIIGYQNGKVDYFRQNDLSDLKRIFDIFLTTNFTSKEIRRIVPIDPYWYIATDFGIVVYDPDRRETRFTISRIDPVNPESPVYDLAYFHDSLWVGMRSGLWVAPYQFEKLLIPGSWKKVNGTGRLPSGAVYEVEASTTLLLCGIGDTTYMYHRDTMIWKPFIDTAHYYFASPASIQILRDSFCVLTSMGNSALFQIEPFSPKPLRKIYPFYAVDGTITWDGYGFAMATVAFGLLFYHMPWWDLDTLTSIHSFPTNSIGHVAIRDGMLYQVPFGRFRWTQPSYHKEGVFVHHLRTDERWIVNPGDSTYFQWGADRVAFHPLTGDVYVSSFGKGLMIFRDKTIKKVFGPEEIPAPPLIVGQDTQYRIGRIQIDAQGTAWIPLWNGFSTNLLAYTTEGRWYDFAIGTASDLLDVLCIDRYGTKWIRSTNGLWVFHENGTLGVKSDDRIRFLSTSTGNGALPSPAVNVVVEDREGAIWVGTNKGGVVFYNPSAIFEGGMENDAVCPILDYRCFLTYEEIHDIEVDGANRKWVGTNNGVYVTSPDGTRLIAHFTMENSPLPSNQVVDIAWDPETGEIFFATPRGVVSYTGEATEPSQNPSSDLYAFPNPVPPSYSGPVTIRGTGADAVLRITTVDGKLVRTLRSQGGQAIWDGRDSYGNRVAPGIYLIFVSDINGEVTGVTKLTWLD